MPKRGWVGSAGYGTDRCSRRGHAVASLQLNSKLFEDVEQFTCLLRVVPGTSPLSTALTLLALALPDQWLGSDAGPSTSDRKDAISPAGRLRAAEQKGTPKAQ